MTTANKSSFRSRIKEFRNVPASQLKANKLNWHTHPQAQFDSLKTMLKEIGYVGAVIARELPDKTLQIIDGHLRTGISEMGGKDELVPTLIVDLTEKEAKKILATYDPISAMAETDTEALGKLLKQITLPSDLVEKIWDKQELDQLGMGKPQNNIDLEPQINKAEEWNKKWQVKRGDLWQCGNHLILCGDSANTEDVTRLIGEERAGLVVTSPPYFNQREYAQWTTYENYLAFVTLVVNETTKHVLNDALFAVNIGSDEPARRWIPSDWWQIIRDNDAGWLYRECIAWVKAAAVWSVPRSMHIENGHYFPAQRWEVILVASRGKHPKFEMSDHDAIRKFDENVWQITVVSGSEQKAIGHNAPFPIEIPRRLIMAYTTKNKIVYDPFLGSGSTIMACEELGRIGRGMEIKPEFVAVSLQRLNDTFSGINIHRIDS